MNAQGGPRPTVFVGSSAEGLPVARALQSLLDRDADVTVWSNGVFGPGSVTLLALLQAVSASDFGILVVDPDDSTSTRGVDRPTARDNVIFELGLFVGHLGMDRCFMVHDRSRALSLPSDLAGVVSVTYQPHASGELESAVGAAANEIRKACARLGVRANRLSDNLEQAATSLADSKVALDRAVYLLARSRVVELDVTARKFGPMLDPGALAAMRKDLADLQALIATDGDR